MGAVPRSLLIAVRDVAALTAVAFVGATAVAAACTRVLQREYAAHTWPGGIPIDVPFVWSQVAQTGWQWTRGVAVWLAVCWCATRGRGLLRTVWLPATAGLVVLGLRTVLPLLGAGAATWWDLWPGPSVPYSLADMWDNPSVLHLMVLHPAWGFPLLFAALVVSAAVLGARSGRGHDDAASRHVAPVSRRGAAAAAVIVGLPALGAIAGALVSWHASAGSEDPALAGPSAAADYVVAPLAIAVLACALLSGTGPVGGALATTAAVLAAGPLVLGWMFEVNTRPILWFELTTYTALGVPAGMVVACVAAAVWRPVALWGGAALARLGSPPAQPSPLPPPLTDDAAAR
jgi:hypothetical protein